MHTGFATRSAAAAAVSTSGYRVEVVELKDGSFAALARNGFAADSPIGTWDARLHLPGRWVGAVTEIAGIVGAEVM